MLKLFLVVSCFLIQGDSWGSGPHSPWQTIMGPMVPPQSPRNPTEVREVSGEVLGTVVRLGGVEGKLLKVSQRGNVFFYELETGEGRQVTVEVKVRENSVNACASGLNSVRPNNKPWNHY